MNLPTSTLLVCLFALFCFSPARSETVVYVSEGGDKRIGIFSLNETEETLNRIGEVELNGGPGCLALGKNRKFLHAAVRTTGEFATLEISPKSGKLKVASTAPASGSAAYVYPDRTGQWLLAAYYREGLVSVSKITNGAVRDEPLWVLDIGPKAHCIQTDPANRFAFCPHPMDLNCVDLFRFDASSGELTLNTPPIFEAPENQGPRHIQFHPNGKWAYLVNEQGKSVTFCHYDSDKGTLKAQQTLSTHPPDWNPSWGSCADIEITSDGRFLYASNRGHESIAGFSLDEETGNMTSLGQTPTEKIPRSFNLMPGEKYLVAAGQGESRLALYRRNPNNGELTHLQTIPSGKSPAWVLGYQLDDN